MSRQLRAVYRHGSLVPREPLNLPEGAEVELLVQGPLVLAPEITDPQERAALLRDIAERMRQNPIPSESPPLTREDLHARR